MYLEDYHGERSEEDDARYPVLPGLDQDSFIDDGSLVDLVSMAVTGISVGDQPHCWTTLQTDNGALLSPLDSVADSRDYLDWDQVPVIFQYPSESSSVGGGSPGSTCSEVTTPTWSNNTVTTTDHNEDYEKLPSVTSAFSFSRTFCNTIYSEYGSESQSYQDYQDCQQDMVSLLMSIQNDDAQNNDSPFIQTSNAVNEFDLSLIRGDPTSLLNTVDLSSSPSTVCLAGNDQQEPFQDFNPPYYAVGHLVSSQHQQPSALSTINFADEVVGTTESFGNQVILPRNEGLLLGNRRVVESKENEKNGNKSYGKCASLVRSSAFIL